MGSHGFNVYSHMTRTSGVLSVTGSFILKRLKIALTGGPTHWAWLLALLLCMRLDIALILTPQTQVTHMTGNGVTQRYLTISQINDVLFSFLPLATGVTLEPSGVSAGPRFATAGEPVVGGAQADCEGAS